MGWQKTLAMPEVMGLLHSRKSQCFSSCRKPASGPRGGDPLHARPRPRAGALGQDARQAQGAGEVLGTHSKAPWIPT